MKKILSYNKIPLQVLITKKGKIIANCPMSDWLEEISVMN